MNSSSQIGWETRVSQYRSCSGWAFLGLISYPRRLLQGVNDYWDVTWTRVVFILPQIWLVAIRVKKNGSERAHDSRRMFVCVASYSEAWWLQEPFPVSICVTWVSMIFSEILGRFRFWESCNEVLFFAWPLGRQAAKHVSRSVMNWVFWILRVRTTWVHVDQRLWVALKFAHVSVTISCKRFCGVSITVQMIITQRLSGPET